MCLNFLRSGQFSRVAAVFFSISDFFPLCIDLLLIMRTSSKVREVHYWGLCRQLDGIRRKYFPEVVFLSCIRKEQTLQQ